MRRTFARRGDRPARFWQDISRLWSIGGAATSTSATLLGFEAPTATATMTSLPPEDVTILRVVGSFNVTLAAAAGNWTLGLMMLDPGWTPALVASNGFQADCDKRVLWHQSYDASGVDAAAGFTQVEWNPPGQMTVNATASLVAMCPREAIHLDISPKVKLEAGKALTLVAWENVNGSTLTTTSFDMRLLFQRSRRR